ncbi:MAG: Lrp/AsnC family transcriptional regulator [Sarcina sp.]
MKIDEIDLKILQILKKDSKITFKEIGKELHLTGQAVGARVSKISENNIIKNFTINIDNSKIKNDNIYFLKVYMTANEHLRIINLINNTKEITEPFRIAGDGCYMLKVETKNEIKLNEIIDKITVFANFQVSNIISKIK